MRHRVSGTKFNVDKDHRQALLRNLVTSLILHEEITTTEAKARAVKVAFDKLVTKAKKNDLESRRVLSAYLFKKEAHVKLFDQLIPKMQGRTSGYTTSEKLIGERAGDSAKMMRVKILVDAATEVVAESK